LSNQDTVTVVELGTVAGIDDMWRSVIDRAVGVGDGARNLNNDRLLRHRAESATRPGVEVQKALSNL
jgi:hypothetical protein